MADETSSKTPEQMGARITELEKRLAKGSSISFKVSEKGAGSVYGLRRFPVTLYLEQWEALLAQVAESVSVHSCLGGRRKTPSAFARFSCRDSRIQYSITSWIRTLYHATVSVPTYCPHRASAR